MDKEFFSYLKQNYEFRFSSTADRVPIHYTAPSIRVIPFEDQGFISSKILRILSNFLQFSSTLSSRISSRANCSADDSPADDLGIGYRRLSSIVPPSVDTCLSDDMRLVYFKNSLKEIVPLASLSMTSKAFLAASASSSLSSSKPAIVFRYSSSVE